MGKFSINIKGSEFGALKSKINLSPLHFKKRRSATTTGINTEIIFIQIPYLFFPLILVYFFSKILSSVSCFISIFDGESIITSLPELFFGKAMKSLMLSSPPSIAHNLSNPNATPP